MNNFLKGKTFPFVVVLFLMFLVFVLLRIASSEKVFQPSPEGKLTVVVSLYPLFDFVKEVGKERVNTILLLPPGAEPHAFEPEPGNVLAINKADLFIYTGKFMEVWVDDIIKGIRNKNLKIIEAGGNLQLINGENKDQKEDRSKILDPHIWLDFDNAKFMVDNIAQGLAEKDPANKDFYLENADSYKKFLDDLDKDYRTTLADCKTRKIVYVGHYAFGYLAKKYDLEYLPVIKGFEPDAEPTANDLVQLATQIKQNGIRYIFYEELTSPKVAEVIGKETKAKLLLLNASHNVSKGDLDRGISFISIMRDNLNNLKTGLECK